MADEQPQPMEQEASKTEPPEAGAGYDDAEEVRPRPPGRPAACRRQRHHPRFSPAGQVGGEGGDGRGQ